MVSHKNILFLLIGDRFNAVPVNDANEEEPYVCPQPRNVVDEIAAPDLTPERCYNHEGKDQKHKYQEQKQDINKINPK